jgi:hypothetical protein
MNEKTKHVPANQVTVILVKCRQKPGSDFQNWIDHLSSIYSVCSACQARTDYGNNDPRQHYDRFIAVGKRNKGESFDQCMDRLEAAIKANPDSFRKDWV